MWQEEKEVATKNTISGYRCHGTIVFLERKYREE
jgi:hypothetical protein